LIPLLLLAWSGGPYASELTNGVFSVAQSKSLRVSHKGVPLIDGDAINYVADMSEADEIIARRVGKVETLHVVLKDDATARFRKEVALHADGPLELTVRMRLMPYRNKLDMDTVTYTFRVPAMALDKTRFKALTGRVYRTKEVEGSFNASRADGELVKGGARFIAFERDGLALAFDCDPYGLVAMGDYCRYGDPTGKWTVAKKGEYVEFSFGQRARFYGGIFAGKVLIYPGKYDWDAKHAHREWSYHGPTKPTAQFTFGVKADTKGFQKADCAAYAAARGWGWTDPTGLTTVSTESAAVMDNCVTVEGSEAREFRIDVKPGLYVVTVRAGHNTRPLGPFDISVDGKPCGAKLRVAAGDTETFLYAAHVRPPSDALRIAFNGPGAWAVRSVVVQTVIYRNEDFTFDRGTWVAKGLYVPEIE